QDELNRYLLTVTNLTEDRYEIVADGRRVGSFTAQQLAAGVNIASSTADPWQPGGPWNAQADVLRSLTDARNEIATARSQAGAYLHGGPTPQVLGQQADRANEQTPTMQLTVTQP